MTHSLHQHQDKLLHLAASGDKQAREDFIRIHMPFILRAASQTSHRFLQWGRDDELSISMMAFNEAIDSFQAKPTTDFKTFAKLVIKRRLIDYFRKTKNKENPAYLESVYTFEDWEKTEREQEVIRYEQALQAFDLDFNMVAKLSPKHAKTRSNLQKAAHILAENDSLMKSLRTTGKLPQKELSQLTGLTSRVLERGRVYVISLALLLADGDFPYLKESISTVSLASSKLEEGGNGNVRN